MIRVLLLVGTVSLISQSLLLAQTADFSADFVSGCAPLTVHFQDQSTGGSSWLWDLGKGAGSTSALQNPSAVYTEPGVYTIALTINGSVTKTKVAFIEVFEKPQVDWSTAPSGTCSPLLVAFTNSSQPGSGTIASANWFFGDGAQSTVLNPTHTYENAGTYSVTLSVKNSKGCETVRIKENALEVQGVRALFVADIEVLCEAPGKVKFTNQSAGDGALTWDWSFGDGDHSSDQNPEHVFEQPGSYDVELVARNSNGCTGTAHQTILVANESGIDFNFNVARACTGQVISISEQSTKNVVSRSWNFGNGVISASFNPTITYTTSGTYTVTLQALLEGNQCPSFVKKEMVIVPDAQPQFTFTQVCGRKVSFQSSATNVVSATWDFGDGITSTDQNPKHTYAIPGTFVVRLTGYNELSCAQYFEKEIVVNGDPIATFTPDKQQDCIEPSLSGCAPFALTLHDNSFSDLPYSVKWVFNDGTQSSNSGVSKTFTTKGQYEALLTVTNSLGCTDTAKAKIRVADTKPVAKFEVDKTSVCVGEVVHFKDVSQNGNFSCWTIGPDLFNTSKEFDYTFGKPGTYLVNLTSKNDGCSNTTTTPLTLEVKDPFVDFSVVKSCSDPNSIYLESLSEEYTSLEWDFGDGTESTDVSATHTYPIGIYSVKLTARSDATGCEVSVEKPLLVQKVKADFSLAEENVCKTQPLTFIDKSTSAVAWEWLFSTGEGSELQNPVINASTPGVYSARLRVTDSDGCTAVLEKQEAFRIIDIVGDFNFTSASTCDKMTATFQDLSVGNPEVTEWTWDFGDGVTSTDQNPVHDFTDLGVYSVRLGLTNALGKCSIEKQNVVTFTNPIPNFTLIKNEYCAGEPVSFINLSEMASQFEWSFGDGTSSQVGQPTVSYNTPGTYTVSLIARDNLGCSLNLSRPNVIRIRKPVAAFEAFQTSSECPPLITAFVNHSSNDVVNWFWDFGDGQMSALSTPSNTYRKPGIFDVSLVVNDAIGCKDTMKLENLVSVGGPTGTYAYPTSACIKDTLLFSANATNTVVYKWDFGNGTVVEGGASIENIYAKPGTYRPLVVLIDAAGCQVPLDDGPNLAIYDRPQIDFTVEPEFPFVGETVTLLSASSEPTSMTWTWPENLTAGDTVQVSFTKAGVLTVHLKAVNDHGCDQGVERLIRVQEDISDLPNVFTPATVDDKNDTFEIPAVENGTWKLTIYNRWGNLVFSQPEYQNEWDARAVSAGVYYYTLQNNLRKERQLKGFVHVMK